MIFKLLKLCTNNKVSLNFESKRRRIDSPKRSTMNTLMWRVSGFCSSEYTTDILLGQAEIQLHMPENRRARNIINWVPSGLGDFLRLSCQLPLDRAIARSLTHSLSLSLALFLSAVARSYIKRVESLRNATTTPSHSLSLSLRLSCPPPNQDTLHFVPTTSISFLDWGSKIAAQV